MERNTKIPFFATKERRSTHFTNMNGTPRIIQFTSSRNKTKQSDAYKYFKSKLILNNAFANSPDGIYTWLMKTLPDSSILFVAGFTKSNQEVGTLHSNLDSLTPKGRIIGAGELIKDGRIIQYNLQSGSYMKKIFDKSPDKEALKEQIDNAFITYMNSIGFNDVMFMDSDDPENTFIGQGVIDTAQFNTQLNNIENYKRTLNYEYRGGRKKYTRRHQQQHKKQRTYKRTERKYKRTYKRKT
jgi:hypothetical protein